MESSQKKHKNNQKSSKSNDKIPLSNKIPSKNQNSQNSNERRKVVKQLKKKFEKRKSVYMTDEDLEMDIPLVPEAPKKKVKLTVNSRGLSTDLLIEMKKLESEKVKVVLVNCERCKKIIPVPIPKNFISKSKLPVVPISYIHKNPQHKDQHCITLHVDHDFDIRRQRISDVIFSP